MSRVDNPEDRGFPFLEEVKDHDLRIWIEFTGTPLFAFLCKHFEKKTQEVGKLVLKQRVYAENIYELAVEQGRAAGRREVLNDFFDKVRAEHERRVSRHADERAGRTG